MIRTTSSAACASSARNTVMLSRPPGPSTSSTPWPKAGRPAATRTASARLCTSRRGSSRVCAETQATAMPMDRYSRRHCASREVLPKPAGACTTNAAWSRRVSALEKSRARDTRWRGTRGGVTLSNRSWELPASPGVGKVAKGVSCVEVTARDCSRRASGCVSSVPCARYQQKSPEPSQVPGFCIDGRCERIRTLDPLHPMQVRYQAALHAEARNYSLSECSDSGSSSSRIVESRSRISNSSRRTCDSFCGQQVALFGAARCPRSRAKRRISRSR